MENLSQLQSSAEVEALIRSLEDESLTKFITFSVDRQYNDKDWQPLPMNRVHWQWAGGSGMPAIKFTGIPFMFVGSKRLVCHQGKDLAVAQKRKYFEEKVKKKLEDQNFGGLKCRRASKKVGCPAAVSISKLAVFPKFKMDDNTERAKKKASKMLRIALERDPVVWETLYAVIHSSEHAGHANGMNETKVSSESSLPLRKRRRKSDLKKKCFKLTKQLMHSLHTVEDLHTLEDVSQVLNTLLKDVAALSSSVDGQLQAKRLRVSAASPSLLSQRCLGRPKHTDSLDA
uniref:Uncharacterized protein n=1 Tax=Nothobranchius pienaari TaxID=704102 RepID=A0A1A8N0C5_9TELE